MAPRFWTTWMRVTCSGVGFVRLLLAFDEEDHLPDLGRDPNRSEKPLGRPVSNQRPSEVRTFPTLLRNTRHPLLLYCIHNQVHQVCFYHLLLPPLASLNQFWPPFSMIFDAMRRYLGGMGICSSRALCRLHPSL